MPLIIDPGAVTPPDMPGILVALLASVFIYYYGSGLTPGGAVSPIFIMFMFMFRVLLGLLFNWGVGSFGWPVGLLYIANPELLVLLDFGFIPYF